MVKGIKICGVSDKETLEYILNHSNPPKFIGFITNYKKSKRYVKFDTLKKLTNTKRNNVSYVSVLVNPNDEILDKLKNLKIDYYQLYDVGPERTKFIKEKYNKPTIIISIENNMGKGSARSVLGFDIGALIIKCVQLNILEKGGGHKMAGGFVIDQKNISWYMYYSNYRVNVIIINSIKEDDCRLDGTRGRKPQQQEKKMHKCKKKK